MNTLQSRVKALLEATGLPVSYRYPAAWNAFPCLAWAETGNRVQAQADGREYLTELTYAVDIWSQGPAQNEALGAEIDRRMAAAGLRRDYMADLFDARAGFHHRSLRYRCVADGQGRVYQ